MPTNSLSALLLCPTGQDARLISHVLSQDSIDSTPVNTIQELCSANYDNAGLIILAEEAFTTDGIEELNKTLAQQGPWSDIPIILLTSMGVRNKEFKLKRLEMFVSSGNVTLLERPLRPLTLMSATHCEKAPISSKRPLSFST